MSNHPSQPLQPLEAAIDRYITDHSLGGGARLPVDRLVAAFGADEAAVVTALRAAEAKGKVAEANGVWTIPSALVLDDKSFSFTSSASGYELKTRVLFKERRQPHTDQESVFFATEQRAVQLLNLEQGRPFITISRIRSLKGIPRALQTVYLNPELFPDDFLLQHDFESESLIRIYRDHHYTLISRDTELTARPANSYERLTLGRPGVPIELGAVVLDVEQCLYAASRNGQAPFVLEFLKASYFHNWRYVVKNRPSASREA